MAKIEMFHVIKFSYSFTLQIPDFHLERKNTQNEQLCAHFE